MNANDPNDTNGLPSEGNSERPEVELQCIGSFKAYTQDQEAYTIEIWTKFGAIHNRDRSRVAPGFMVLTTADGRHVERIDQGQYRLVENPEATLSSDDPKAP